MKHISCTVAATAAAFGARRIVTLSAPDLPRMRAGQLVLARVNDTLDPYLPSAYFPLPAGAGSALTLLIAADDPISHKAVGDALELIAPVGNGFALDPATRRLLLLADAARLAPLIALAHEASQKQIAVSLLVHSADVRHGAQADANLAAWLSELLPLDVEYQVTAEPSTVLPGLLSWADQVCAAGDAELYTLLKELMARDGGRIQVFRAAARTSAGVLPPGFAQVIVAPLMACGFGACQGCAVETARGMRLACVDGPVFDLGGL